MIIQDFLSEALIERLGSLVAGRRPYYSLDYLHFLNRLRLGWRRLQGRLEHDVLNLKIFLSDRRPVKGVYSSAFVFSVESVKRRQSLPIRSATPIRYSGKLTVAALIRKGDILDLL